MNQSLQIQNFLLRMLVKHPHDIVKVAALHFQVSRTTIHRHLNTLHKNKKITKSGHTRQISYYLATSMMQEHRFKVSRNLNEHDVWMKYVKPLFEKAQQNIKDIAHYGFTEIFNNAIDHAQANTISIECGWENAKIKLQIEDDGVGVFEKINRVLHFTDYKESLLHLSKGKLTTDPINHTGEGLFFAARLFDEFFLQANQYCFTRNNVIDDWSIASAEHKKGTKIIMIISESSTRKMIDLFARYTDSEAHSFVKTDLLVDLSLYEGESLISRSQAKRLLSRLSPFKAITLDFKKVRMVGQGFVDEVFRVYVSKNPGVTIQYINANEEVTFMILRSIPEK